VIDLVDASSDMTSFFSDLFEASVRIYLASGRDRGSVITFIHAVTCTGALHLMAPYLYTGCNQNRIAILLADLRGIVCGHRH
jgi:hypothetical protein